VVTSPLPPIAPSFDEFVEAQPRPLVALVGCTDLHHALTARKNPNEICARYLSLPVESKLLDHQPEKDHPGLLKNDWLYKRTYVVAGVVSLWCAWDAETPSGPILQQIEELRARGRPSCKVVLVLVQRPALAQGPLSPVKDDDRLGQLRKAADLDSKSLLSLMQTAGEGAGAQFDETTTRRVERALLDAALAYYKDEARLNKAAARQARTLEPRLLARHHFKRGYYSEVRRDEAAAAKHWAACYSALREVLRLVVSASSSCTASLHEVKRVSEFVSRKICTAHLAAGRVAEGFDFFRRHIRLFRPWTSAGTQPAAAAAVHLHWGWICKQ